MVDTTDYSQPERDGSPRDLAINQFQDIFWAANGDLAVVNGRENVEQSAALDVLDRTDVEIGSSLTPTAINRVQSEIRDVLEDDPQLASIRTVEPSEYDESANQLTFTVKTVADDEYTVPIRNLADSYTTSEDETYLLSETKSY